MEILIFSVFDRAAQGYLDPWYAPNQDVAIRSFSIAANNPDSNFYKHPQDYSLFCLGTFDAKTGEITPEAPRHVVTALQVTNAPSVEEIIDG